MKDFIVIKIMSLILKYNDYDLEKQEELKYGLFSIYLLVTKLVIVIILALILNIEKEVLLFLLIYNEIRTFSFGLHATKSSICLISSLIIFILLPLICNYLVLAMHIKIILCCITICLIFKNSPADTEKRPIINPKRRLFFKYISTIVAIIYSFISLLITDSFLSNCFILSMILQCIIISPLTYRIFNLPYNNYLTYKLNNGLN